MKKFVVLGIVVLIFTGLVFFINSTKEKPCSNCEKNTDKSKTRDVKFADYFVDETDLCNVLTKETVTNLLVKTIVKTESVTDATLHSCQYYLDDTHALVINYDLTSVDSKLRGHEFLGRKITTNPKIIAKHSVVVQENEMINEIYLVLGPREFVSINRPNGTLISEEEIIDFAAKLGEIVSGIVPLKKAETTKETSENTVPLPQEEDIVRNFFALINEKKPSEAVGMMSSVNTKDDSQKQAWAVQFNDIKSVNVQKIEQSMPENWTADRHTYKVTLEVYVSSNAANAPIPYYGWHDNPNIRWVTIIKEDGLWKIDGLATGP